MTFDAFCKDVDDPNAPLTEIEVTEKIPSLDERVSALESKIGRL